jgi:molybdopterin converting factor small subunit
MEETRNEQRIAIKLFGGLDRRVNPGVSRDGADPHDVHSVRDILASLRLDVSAVGLILVNGLHAGVDTPVAAGDEVSLFPPVGGG